MAKLLKILLAVLACYAIVSGLAAWYLTGTYRPDKTRDKSTVGLDVTDVNFLASDGVRLRGWYAGGQAGAPSIALFHGYNGSRSELLPVARALNLAGYELLLMDMRACGESEGTKQSFGVHEALDVAAAVRFLKDTRKMHARQIGVLGLGTGASAVALAHETVKECGAAVLMAPYATLDGAFDRRLKSKAAVGMMPFGTLASALISRRIGVSPSSVRPIDKMPLLHPCATLIVGAGSDSTSPSDELQSMFSRAKEPKELYIAPGVSRLRLVDLNGSHLRSRIVDFFDEALR